RHRNARRPHLDGLAPQPHRIRPAPFSLIFLGRSGRAAGRLLSSFSLKRKLNANTAPSARGAPRTTWPGQSTPKSTQKAAFSNRTPTQHCFLPCAKSLALPEQNTAAAKANAALVPFC